jgi:PAS domain S-box-containing protein
VVVIEADKQAQPASLEADDRAAPTRPPKRISRRLGAAFVAAAVVLLVGVVAMARVLQLMNAVSGVEHANQIIAELRGLSSALLDSESSVRGYLVTGDPALITRHSTAIADARRHLGRVSHDLGRQHPEAGPEVMTLRTAAEQNIAVMESLLAVARSAGTAAAVRQLQQGAGRREMDAVRTAVDRLARAEQEWLAGRTRERTRNTSIALLVIGGGTLTAFLALAALLAGLQRGFVQDARLQHHLVQQTQRLDAQATELELQNEQLQEQAVTLEEQSSELEAQQTEMEAANEELLRANTEVESARERMRLVLESADAGMYGIDEDTRCTFINPAGARLLGYEPDELIGEFMHAKIHHSRLDGSEYPIEECPIYQSLRNGTPDRVDDEVYWRKDGTPLFVDYTAAPVIVDGETRGVIATFVDISQRKRDEETRAFLTDAASALSSSLDYRKTLVTVAELSVPRLGDWCLVDVLDDAGALQRLAVAHRGPEKLRLMEEWSKERPPRLDAPIGSGRTITTGKPELHREIPEELLVATAGGDAEQLRFLETLQLRSLLSVPLIVRGNAFGAIVYAMAESGRRYTERDLHVAQELAERASIAIENALLYQEAEEARRRAENADRAKSQFLAAMSHELRTPLNAIAGYAELLQVGVHGPVTDKQSEALERIQRSQKALLALINDILNFSKLEAGFIEVETIDVPVGEMLETIDAWVEPQLRTKQLHYAYEACSRELAVRGDRDKIQQVMLNLLSNAVKFTPSGGHIAVKCEQSDDSVAILVRDDGPGIPPDKLEAIFEPFVQVDREAQSTQQGTGLGLAISQDLARAMGGDLHAESTLGEGSTFILTLPRAQEKRTKDAERREPVMPAEPAEPPRPTAA